MDRNFMEEHKKMIASPVGPKHKEEKGSMPVSRFHQEYNFYDRTMKKLFRLSKPVVIDFINALYKTDYNRDNTEVEFLGTEYIKADASEIRSDMMLKVNDEKYHLEFQMKNDKAMTIRLFDYEFEEARKSRIDEGSRTIMEFATPKVIYLRHNESTPDRHILELRFGPDGTIIRNVDAVKALSMRPEQLAEEKLYLLLPFQLLRSRELVNPNLEPSRKEKLLTDYKNTMKSCIMALEELSDSERIEHSDYVDLYQALQEINEHVYRNVPEVMKGSETQMVNEKIMTFTEECEARGEARAINYILQMQKKGYSAEEAVTMYQEQMQKNTKVSAPSVEQKKFRTSRTKGGR